MKRFSRSSLPVAFAFTATLVASIAYCNSLPAQVPMQLQHEGKLPPLALLRAYRYAFHVYAGGDGLAIARGSNAVSGSASRDELRLQFGLTVQQFAPFQNAALDYRWALRSTQSRIEAIVQADRASHPTVRPISPAAKTKVHALFSELERQEAEAVDSVHRALDANAGQTLDEKVLNLYAGSQAKALNFRPQLTAIGSSGLAPNADTASPNTLLSTGPTSGPDMTQPGYCYYGDPDLWDDAEEECADGGGDFNLEDCECDFPGDGGGGGGGGGGPPPPTITGDYHDLWYFGPGINAQSSGATQLMYVVNLTANGAGTAVWSVTTGQNEVVLTSQGNTAKVTSSGNTFSSTQLDVSVTVTMDGLTSGPWQITTHTPYRMIAGSHDHVCDSDFGYRDVIHYNVQDQLQGSLSLYTFDFNENFTTPFTNVNSSNWVGPSMHSATNSDIEDEITGYGLGNSPAPIPTPVCSGNDAESQHVSQQWWVGSLNAGSGVMLQTDQLTRYADKGAHNNIVAIHP